MVPWRSSNPSTLNSSAESLAATTADQQSRHVRTVRQGTHQAQSEAMLFNNATAVHQHQTSLPESYEEFKRLLVLAGLFFLLMCAFVLIKFQVAIDDIFRWSPAVWLIGVVICALLMNVSVQIRRFVQRLKTNRRRLREEQNLLFSPNFAGSFSNLSPSQLHQHICRHHRERFYSASMPPSYEQIHRCALASPPAFVVCVQRQQHNKAPPKYKAADVSNPQSTSSSEEDISPPSYAQSQHEEQQH